MWANWYWYYCKLNRYKWYTDQILLKKYIEEFKVKNNDLIIELNDKVTKFSRIDRVSLDEDIKKLDNKEIKFSDLSKEDQQVIMDILNQND